MDIYLYVRVLTERYSITMSAFKGYVTGYVLSAALTAAAFGLVHYHLATERVWPPHELVVPVIVFLAVAQFFIQLIFFLHLGREEKPRWRSISFCFAAFIVIVLVGGTFWIMDSLNSSHEHDLSEIYPTGEISSDVSG